MAVLRLLLLSLGIYIFPQCNISADDDSRTILQRVVSAIDSNRSFIENAAMIQRAFCKDQTSCRRSVAETNVSMETPSHVQMHPALDSIDSTIPGCCHPCSCNDNCLDIGNCCLDKLENMEPDSEPLRNYFTISSAQCVAANVLSYTESAELFIRRQRGVLMAYYMKRTCATDGGTASVERKCTSPDPELIDEAVPVTAVTSKRHYYNRYCAQCNGETDTIPWTIRIAVWNGIPFCDGIDSDRCMPISANVTKQFTAVFKFVSLRNIVQIVYEPPRSIQTAPESMCIPNAMKATDSGCLVSDNLASSYDERFLIDACSLIRQPFWMGLLSAYANVFCTVCEHGDQKSVNITQKKVDCHTYKSRGFGSSSFTALLKYGADQPGTMVGRGNAVTTPAGRSQCGCTGMWDPLKNICRPLSCRLGTWNQGCGCTSAIGDVSGLVYSLHVKLTADDADYNVTDVMTTVEYNKTVMSYQLQNMWIHVTIIDVVLFPVAPRNVSKGYMHAVVMVKTELDREASDVICEAASRLDHNPTIKIGNSALRMYLTSAFGNSQLQDLHMDMRTDIKSKYLAITSSNNFTKLLCCRYVVLHAEEVRVSDVDGALVLNATGNRIPDGYRYPDDGGVIGICADDYAALLGPAHVSGTSSQWAWLNNGLSVLLLFAMMIVMCFFEG